LREACRSIGNNLQQVCVYLRLEADLICSGAQQGKHACPNTYGQECQAVSPSFSKGHAGRKLRQTRMHTRISSHFRTTAIGSERLSLCTCHLNSDEICSPCADTSPPTEQHPCRSHRSHFRVQYIYDAIPDGDRRRRDTCIGSCNHRPAFDPRLLPS
jgi:hypothetical protein